MSAVFDAHIRCLQLLHDRIRTVERSKPFVSMNRGRPQVSHQRERQQFIAANYRTMTVQEMADALNVGRKTIYHHASVLRIEIRKRLK